MTFLRMGVSCAVLNDDGHILLSQRGDLGAWNLPSGRLDAHEYLEAAALREVREETGIEARIVRPLGLYYHVDWQRLNVLYMAQPVGGVLRQQTAETRANRFFPPAALPDNLLDRHAVQIGLLHGTALHNVVLPAAEARRRRRRFALRWVQNLLSGRPEPRYPRFVVQASLIAQNAQGDILSLPDDVQKRILPGITCHGREAPWEQIYKYVRDTYDLYELRQAHLSWSGLYEDTAHNRIELIFAVRLHVDSALSQKALAWTHPDSTAWWHGYKPYITHWHLHPDDVLTLHQIPAAT